ncbi:MAG: GNAT family N-acetyltransferase [Candidatus Limnocylindrales bacterium]
MPDLGIVIPAGHSLVSLAERPDLVRPAGQFNGSVWPEFMLQDPVVQRYWHLLDEAWSGFQLVLLDAVGAIAATNNAAPIHWNGTDEDLPAGWDQQLERSAEQHAAGVAADTLGAIQIVVDPSRRGDRLAGVMVDAMRSNARAHGFGHVIACVRPTDKHRFPLIPIENYAFWTRADGEPFDAWIRLHARLGARIVRGSPEAMTMRGSVADWEAWTGLEFPGSGSYIVPFAASPVEIDRVADEGVYHDPNVWVVHTVD